MNERANDYVKEWLGAYVDGELSADRRSWVEDHLVTCASCRRELAELRALTTLLHADPAPASFLESVVLPQGSTEAFTRQVIKNLPRPVQPAWQRALRLGLRFTPLGLFGAWAFTQAVIWVSTALLYALRLFPQTESWLAWVEPGLNYGAGGWLGGLLSLSGLDSLTGDITGSVWFISLMLINLAVLLFLAVLFFAWLAGLWAYQRNQLRETI